MTHNRIKVRIFCLLTKSTTEQYKLNACERFTVVIVVAVKVSKYRRMCAICKHEFAVFFPHSFCIYFIRLHYFRVLFWKNKKQNGKNYNSDEALTICESAWKEHRKREKTRLCWRDLEKKYNGIK